MNFDKLLDYIKKIDLTKAKGKTLKIDKKAEKTIHKLVEAEKFIDEAKKVLKERFLEIAKKNPRFKKYEGEIVSVGYTVMRRKQVTSNADKPFYIIEKKPNTKAIEAFRETMGKLPKGIEEKTFEYIRFKIN